MATKRKKGKRKRGKEMYCDACVLEEEMIFHEMTGKDKKIGCISHLALGEAYGNCLKKGSDAADRLFEFIEKLEKNKYVRVIGHDGIEHLLRNIMDYDELRMSASDAIHMATAIKNGCNEFKTADASDFQLLDEKKIKEATGKHIAISLPRSGNFRR